MKEATKAITKGIKKVIISPTNESPGIAEKYSVKIPGPTISNVRKYIAIEPAIPTPSLNGKLGTIHVSRKIETKLTPINPQVINSLLYLKAGDAAKLRYIIHIIKKAANANIILATLPFLFIISLLKIKKYIFFPLIDCINFVTYELS